MSLSPSVQTSRQHTTPPSSFEDPPLTPPPTDKPRALVHPVIELFEAIKAGECGQEPWTEFKLTPKGYDEVERQLRQKVKLWGFVKDKIRYDYDREGHRLVVRMPTAVHEVFIARLEDAIFSELKLIRGGSDYAAAFAQKLYPARSTEIKLTNESTTTSCKHEPDASFWHDNALYPGVIIEVAYTQKKSRLNRLAENYILDSDGNVQVVVGIGIAYSNNGLRKATLSVWRPRLLHTAEGDELSVETEVEDKAFRDELGNPTDYPGLRLQLSDFACEELTRDLTNENGREILVPTYKLCQFLAAAEDKIRGEQVFVRSVRPGVKKRRRSITPTERMASEDEARYMEQEKKKAKRLAESDSEYHDTSP